jgi:hypothetical protein
MSIGFNLVSNLDMTSMYRKILINLIYCRCMVADQDENNSTGTQHLMLDSPKAIDGLEIWVSIKSWVNDLKDV